MNGDSTKSIHPLTCILCIPPRNGWADGYRPSLCVGERPRATPPHRPQGGVCIPTVSLSNRQKGRRRYRVHRPRNRVHSVIIGGYQNGQW